MEYAKTVDQALVLLASLAEDGPASVSELARRTGTNRTVAHRLLATLDRHAFVRRHDDGGYRLGMALLRLGALVQPELRRLTRPALARLAARCGETAVLSVPDGDEVVAVDQVPVDRHPVRVEYRRGYRHPQTRGAHGRAVLAFADPGTVGRLLAGLAPGEAGRVAGALEETRARGYAVSHDELQLGASGVAAPVREPSGAVVASLGIVAPVSRFPDEASVAHVVVSTAAAVDRALAGRPSAPDR